MRKYALLLIGLILIPACMLFPGVGPTADLAPQETGTVALPTVAPIATPTHQPSTPSLPATPSGEPAPAFGHLRMFSGGVGWSVGAASQAASQIFRTRDGGFSWEYTGPPQAEAAPNGFQAHAFFLDAQHAWVTYYPSEAPAALGPSSVWHTSDGGASWIPGFTPPTNPNIPDYAFEALYFSDPQNGWLMLAHSPGAGNAPVSIFHTQDAGVHWEVLVDPFTGNADRLHTCCRAGMLFLDSLNGFVPYGGGPYTMPMVHVTHDGGRTWESQELPPAEPHMFARAVCGSGSPSALGGLSVALVVSCFDPNRPAPIPIPYLYTSDDAGVNWQSQPLPDETVQSAPLRNYRRDYSLQFIDAQHAWLFVQDEDWAQGDPPAVWTHIFQTQDGGSNWVKLAQVDWIGEFSFTDPSDGWVNTRQGNMLALLRTSDGGALWQPVNPVLLP